MRTSIAALILALLASLGVFAPVASAAPAGPKVVIIVGPTHGATASYRTGANAAYAEAIKYTSNVVKVYSPNATWAKVKAAVVGASIVIYFGHGNGWPSPYTFDAKYTTKDGFGLNATAGNGDANTKYYGEPSVSTMKLAPNAVVILSHLCYASGNSEPGDPAPSVSTARQRVDNFAAGFLKVARAVIADGHRGPEGYIRALFKTHATIEEVWRNQPNFHDHVSAFPSTRTPGAMAYTDTDTATSGYYRSLVTRPGLTTDDVTGATYADTGGDPAQLQVPGNAVVDGDGAILHGDPSLGTSDAGDADAQAVPAGTRLRVISAGFTIQATGDAPVRVEGVDDPSIKGWVASADLLARDSAAPAIWGVDTGGGVLSPNGDGRFDTATIRARFSESVTWRIRILDGTTVLKEAKGTGDALELGWDGKAGGALLPDGAYGFEITGDDAWGNGPAKKTGKITIDTVPAQVAAVTPGGDPVPWFSPNGDGSRDSTTWTATTDEPGSLVMSVHDGGGKAVFTSVTANGVGTTALPWSGKNDAGKVVPDGLYEVRIAARDAAGSTGDAVIRSARVATTLGFVTSSKTVIYPHDNDKRGRSTTLGFKLARPATVTWTIVNAAGSVVDTIAQDQPRAAGAVTRVFDGRRTDGVRLPKGKYKSVVVAVDDLGTVSQSVGFEMNAFAITSSDTTPARSQTITIKATTAEKLSTRPRLYVYQPGKARWSVLMTKKTTYGYAIKIKLKTGKAGTVTFKVVAKDKEGHKQSTKLAFPIH